MTSSRKLLDLVAISKRFSGSYALENVDFDLVPGEIHVLFGENGAGKSTLINIIAGVLSPSSGEIFYNGERLEASTPASARSVGIAAVFQEFSLVSDLSVSENIYLGREIKKFGLLAQQTMRAGALKILDELRFHISPDVRVGDLSRAQQQMVEIAKALLHTPNILILDEPTASLTEAEVVTLFKAVNALRANGVGIIYVTHRMPEIRKLADRVTVLRDGRKIATVTASDRSDAELVALMVGRQIDQLYPKIEHRAGTVRLAAKDLCVGTGAVSNASVQVHAGEIVGIGGLLGSGKSEFIRALFGLEPITSGSVVVDDEEIAQPTPSGMIERKLCYFPADRNAEGLALWRSTLENMSITALKTRQMTRGPFLKRRAERATVLSVARMLTIDANAISAPVATLSGGNRQKAMLARGLTRATEIFLFEEPTVGIDVGAKVEVYEAMKALVEEGHAVLLVSSDLPELLHLSHRLLVFREGSIVADLHDHELDEGTVLSHFFGRNSATDGIEVRA